MATLATLRDRIALEIRRKDIPAQITHAIQDAIRLYSGQRFWFTEQRDGMASVLTAGEATLQLAGGEPLTSTNAMQTAPGQEFYQAGDWPAISSMAHIDSLLLVDQSGSRWRLEPRTPQWMDDAAVTASRSMPTDYSYFARALRFYPVPDRRYQVLFTGTGRWAVPEADGDTSIWLTEGEILIRRAAKRILYAEILRDPEQAAIELKGEQEALDALQRETMTRGGVARVRVRSWF